ncbi:MAG TPA: trehalase family glycosidase [Bacteroidales bacterium]|nr:trehalase family glycosidase [Bacteroidales bacterium]
MTKVKSVIVFILISILGCSCGNDKTGTSNAITTTEELQESLARGWNTWNTRNVLSNVLLPEYFAIDLQLYDPVSDKILNEVLIGQSRDGEKVTPGPHAYDGSYTMLTVDWRGIKVVVKTAASEDDIAISISPEKKSDAGKLIINPQMLWGKEGSVEVLEDGISMKTSESELGFYLTSGSAVEASDTAIICSLTETIWITTYKDKDISELESFISREEKALARSKAQYGDQKDLYDAMQTVLAWDVIYEPVHERVISPVSRVWSTWNWKGWVLFEWDTYFAAYMYSMDSKALAYANALAITNSLSPAGFVPNYASARGNSNDRSQPPVGSYVIWKIYEQHQEKWFLEETFDELLSWNRWWAENRDYEGYLCWGSTPYTPEVDDPLNKYINTKRTGKYESGLDNSPMYDDAQYDTTLNLLMLADVGLMSMYVWDCNNIIKIAKEIGRTGVVEELEMRAEKYGKKLQTMYDESVGIYLNKDLTTSEYSHRLSPTNFYPLLAGVPAQEQAERMIDDHFYNPDEFWGEWMIPSIARNDVAFEDNVYWRGRIWAPLNFLVYIGLKNYDLPDATKDLVEKSRNLILKSWLEEHHVYENYNAVTGEGGDVRRSDKFYHWGALLAYISLLEEETRNR